MNLGIVFLAIVGFTCGQRIPYVINSPHDWEASAIDWKEITRINEAINRLHIEDDMSELEMEAWEFMRMLPIKEVRKMAQTYKSKYEEVQAAVDYLDSIEYKNFVDAVERNQEYVKFCSSLPKTSPACNGSVFGFDPLKTRPAKIKGHRESRAVYWMLGDAKALCPHAELQALFNKKLSSNPDFKILYEKVKSQEFQDLLKTVQDLPETKIVVADLRELGVEVAYIADFFKSMFGDPQ